MITFETQTLQPTRTISHKREVEKSNLWYLKNSISFVSLKVVDWQDD